MLSAENCSFSRLSMPFRVYRSLRRCVEAYVCANRARKAGVYLQTGAVQHVIRAVVRRNRYLQRRIFNRELVIRVRRRLGMGCTQIVIHLNRTVYARRFRVRADEARAIGRDQFCIGQRY